MSESERELLFAIAAIIKELAKCRLLEPEGKEIAVMIEYLIGKVKGDEHVRNL